MKPIVRVRPKYWWWPPSRKKAKTMTAIAQYVVNQNQQMINEKVRQALIYGRTDLWK
jgi:hypothetical protein